MRFLAVVVFAVSVAGCSSSNGGGDGDGGGGGSGGGSTECQPAFGDCMSPCPGGTIAMAVRPECGPIQCVCPPTCMSNADCAADELCRFSQYGCGGDGQIGYCDARPDPITCPENEPACGCDGQVYESRCDASVAGVPITDAPGTNCDAERLPCTDDPSGLACYAENEWCYIDNGTCERFNTFSTPCYDLTCECLSQIYEEQNALPCTCTELPSGLHVIDCEAP